MPLSTLNNEQLQAAQAPLGHNLVIASAGTGKTSTIVGRIAHLLQQGVEPSDILLLTFTNKAAGEMIARLGRYFPKKTVGSIEAGTFHAVCYRKLKEMDPHLTLKQPGELRTLFRSLYEKRRFERMHSSVKAFSASFLYDEYMLYQNASLDGFDRWFLKRHEEHEPYMDAYVHLIEEFESEKKRYGFLSFNDLLLRMLDMARDDSSSVSGYREILVDEYQDTNTLQGVLIDAMRPRSLFCVGDYDQSIYAFNGANIENIATFQERYPQARIYTLSINYRSGAAILSLANRVIERNKRIYPKKLIVGKEGKNHPPKLLVYEDLYEQYRGIAHHIKQSFTPGNEIAVIFRNNASADGIEAGLRELGIACKRKGGHGFFEVKEIKFLLDTLSFLANPKDIMAFIHIFEYAQGVGSAVARELYSYLEYFGEGSVMRGLCRPLHHTPPRLNRIKNTQVGLFDDDLEIGSLARFKHLTLCREVETHPLLKHPSLTQEGALFFDAFYRCISSCEVSQSPAKLLQYLISSELYQKIVAMLAQQRGRLKNGELDEEKVAKAKERIERKAALLLHLAKPYDSLHRFLNAMILGGGELSEGEGVNLMTVHASKGLEFEEVYVVDLVEGRFPNHKMMSSIEEERRLFYVAVTRAKSKLYLSYAKYDRHKKVDYKPSVFLYEAGLLREE